MSSLSSITLLAGLVIALLLASRQDRAQRFFRWLPVPLWCYVLPMLAVTVGILPREDPSYRWLTHQLLPPALALLLLGVNLNAVLRLGSRALIAAVTASLGISVGLILWCSALKAHLPSAWQGAGTLAATWTGGSLNLLAVRGLLGTPDSVIAPLIVVDALIAYSWMAILIAASGSQKKINRWLGAREDFIAEAQSIDTQKNRSALPAVVFVTVLAFCLALSARYLADRLPTSFLVSSAMGWTVLLVTTTALLLSLIPRMQRIGAQGAFLGYPLLYLVLAATGAQADAGALLQAPLWLVVGVLTVLTHAGFLLLAGKLFRIPVGLLATASQSNLGGFVSGPLVGAVYHRTLAPVGLILAMAGSAFGTYLGLATASIAKFLGL